MSPHLAGFEGRCQRRRHRSELLAQLAGAGPVPSPPLDGPQQRGAEQARDNCQAHPLQAVAHGASTVRKDMRWSTSGTPVACRVAVEHQQKVGDAWLAQTRWQPDTNGA